MKIRDYVGVGLTPERITNRNKKEFFLNHVIIVTDFEVAVYFS